MSENTADPATSPFVTPTWPDRIFAAFRRREWMVLLLAVILQVVVLGVMIVHRATPLVTGDTLLLRVIPVDPRDLFRGDYVILSYDFSRVTLGKIEGLQQTKRNSNQWQGRTVFVSLVPEPDGRHWRADKFSTSRPTSGKYLCGKLSGWNRLEYGIESYYVQEGTGLDYERAVRSRKLSAEVAVTSTGQAALRGLRIE